MVVVVLVGGEEGEVVPGVAVDGVQVGQEVPQPQGDRMRPQQQGGRRLGDGVGQDELEGVHVARSFERDSVQIRCNRISYTDSQSQSFNFNSPKPTLAVHSWWIL